MAGTSHRVVSESSRLAMPEVTIGLFPDVGGSWDLNHLAGRIGRFLAATGAILNAADSLFTGMADYCVRHADWSAIIADLERIDGTQMTDRRQLDQRIHDVLAQHSAAPTLDPGPLQTHYALLTTLCANRDIVSLYRAFAALADHADPWLARSAQTMLKGAPLSVALGLTLQERHCTCHWPRYFNWNIRRRSIAVPTGNCRKVSVRCLSTRIKTRNGSRRQSNRSHRPTSTPC